MLVHFCSYPQTNTNHLPRNAVRQLADAARRAGADVIEDEGAFPGADISVAVASCVARLRGQWRGQRPDLVHTFGQVATMAALEVGGGVPIIATFDESPADEDAEARLAARVTAVLPLSTAEGERWRRRGAPTLAAGVFPFPAPVLDVDPMDEARIEGHVVTFSDGAVLDALVSAMPDWGATELVVGARLDPVRWSAVRARGAELGVLDRLHHRPGLRGDKRSRMWADAALLVAGSEASRHGGQVIEAAAHGVPSVVTAQDAYLDLVVAGTTGILVPPGTPGPTLSRIVTALLEDTYKLLALGCASRVRVRAAHAPNVAGDRLLALYRSPGAMGPVRAAPVVGAGQSDPREESLPGPTWGQTPPAVAAPDPVHREVRDALIADHLPLARQLAGWYTGRGQAREDLVQVACLGLVQAAERFDPTHGTAFHSFAVPTILGELRKHFRDHAWDVRVPRPMQESVLEVRRAADDLQQALGREATPADLSDALGMGQDEVRAALRTSQEARGADSLDHVHEGQPSLAESLGAPDPGHDVADVRGDVQVVLRRLPERERQVLLMRFHAEMTQSQISERLGISQVHVSRLITGTLATIRQHILSDSPLPPAWHPSSQREQRAGTSRTARAS